jgi:predicted kinase
MPTILVSALLLEGGQALLAQRLDGGWELPTTPLGEFESTEEALARLLGVTLGVRSCEDDFVDTIYERRDADHPVIRNVFAVRDWRGTLEVRDADRYADTRWFALSDLSAVELDDDQLAVLRCGLSADPVEALPGAPITILTGPAASGKTTVASRLCRRLERAAHIEVDLLRDMIIAGYASPIPSEQADPVLVAEQTRLAAANAVALARNFSLAGYEVVIDEVIESAETLDEQLEGLAGTAPVSLITLLPDAVTLQSRDAVRDPDLRLGPRCLELRGIYETNGELRGLRLDNSHMSVSETVSWILSNRELARVL